MLLLRIHAVTLHDVEVIVSALKSRLHARQLMLHAVKLHTRFLLLLPDLADFFFFFAKFQINALVLVRQLLRQGVLEPCHKRL